MDGFLVRLHLHDTSAFTHPTFTGRDSELAQLAEWFVFEGRPTVRTVLLTGMAGIGKTQLIYAYFARHAYKYRAIVWCNASSEQTFLADVRSTLEHIGLPQPASDSSCVDQLYIWLQSQDAWPWLLILENYQERSRIIESLLAVRAEGHAIITTCRQATARTENTLQLQEMSLEESSILLLRRAHLLAPDATLDTVPSHLMAQAHALVKAVGGLPLALDQIGAYRAETQESLFACLAQLQKEPFTLFSHRGPLAETGESHPEALTATYSHIFDELAHLHPLSLDLLRVLTFLQAGELQENALRRGAPALSGSLQALLEDTLAFNETIADLRARSLIERQIEPNVRVLRIHPIVRMLVRAALFPQQQHAITDMAARLRSAMPREDQG